MKRKNSGPKTAAGKLASSQNSTSHGMRQERFCLLPGESQSDFDSMAARWRAEYKIWLEHHPGMAQLVDQLIERDWMQSRCLRRIDEFHAQLFAAQDRNDLEAEALLEKRLQGAYRYKTTAENSFNRARKAAEEFRHTRIQEKQAWERIEIARFLAVQRALGIHCQYDIPEDPPKPEVNPLWSKHYVDDRDLGDDDDVDQAETEGKT